LTVTFARGHDTKEEAPTALSYRARAPSVLFVGS